MEIPEVVRNKARRVGAADWLDGLPDLVRALEVDWSITVGRAYADSTEAYVAEATTAEGTPAVLKVLIPRDDIAVTDEIAVLRLTDGEGCVRLFAADQDRAALLLERLGPSLYDLGLPVEQRHRILCTVAARVWRPAKDAPLPTGAQKGQWLIDFVRRMWVELDRPCSERAVEYGIACAERRIAAHDDEGARLVHGDVHQWNTLQAGTDYKLVDPDGLLADPEYDLGIIMREDPVELMREGEAARAAKLADLTGTDPQKIVEWGAIERVSTGLLGTAVGLQPVARQMLLAAERVAAR
jgi:streptomycin 6-kinase